MEPEVREELDRLQEQLEQTDERQRREQLNNEKRLVVLEAARKTMREDINMIIEKMESHYDRIDDKLDDIRDRAFSSVDHKTLWKIFGGLGLVLASVISTLILVVH